MGFPSVGYSELLVAPRLLLHVFFLISYLRRIIFWAFNAVGLGDLLDTDVIIWPENHAYAPSLDHSHVRAREPIRPASAALIQEALPVVRYSEAMAEAGSRVGDGCAVCLYEFEPEEEVRRLGNCRHVFHRGCLDRWVEHGQRTCPLCRTPLVPEEMWHALGCQTSASAGVLDSYDDHDDDLLYSSSPAYLDPFPPTTWAPSQPLLLPHQLFSGLSS